MTQRKTSVTETITFIAVLLLVLLFGYTAFSKLLEYDKFIFQMRLVPAAMMVWAAPILAWLVPAVEFLIVGMLIIGQYVKQWRFAGFYSAFFLLLTFQVYIGSMLLSDSKLPCTCGGIVSQMSWRQHLWFNAVFMLIAAVPILLHYKLYYLLNISRPRERV
jgi:putative oxidoreductase